VLLIEIFGYGFLVPAAVSCLITFLLVRASKALASGALVVGVLAGFWSGYVLLDWTTLWPTSGWHWLPYLALLAGGLGLLVHAFRMPWLAGEGLLLAGMLLTALLLVPDLAERRAQRALVIAGAALGGWLFCWGAARLPGRLPGWLHTAVLMATGLAGAVLLVVSGNLKLGQLCGLMVAASSAGLLPVVSGMLVALRAAVPLQVVVLGGLLLTGYWYSFSEVPAWSYLLTAAAPLAAGLAAHTPLGRHRKWIKSAAACGATAMLLAALGLAFWAEGGQE
jgi:hypothetical protein